VPARWSIGRATNVCAELSRRPQRKQYNSARPGPPPLRQVPAVTMLPLRFVEPVSGFMVVECVLRLLLLYRCFASSVAVPGGT
jgi:hypothetical protein